MFWTILFVNLLILLYFQTKDINKEKKKTTKKPAIEDIYQKKSQLEHILLRPDTYIGSVEKETKVCNNI